MVQADQFPDFLYGTAWKEERTQDLVELALAKGFRGIDTANQRKHYFEKAVGDGIAAAIRDGVIARRDLFIQTKFTYQRGQDHRLPYDPAALIFQQVEQSFSSSLLHLQVERLDSLVLHGPSMAKGLGPDDRAAWKAMEAIHKSGQVRHLGVSNISLNQLKLLCEEAAVLPTFVQNRCYAKTGWDHAVRTFCNDNSIVYQGFSLLTANRAIFAMPALKEIAKNHRKAPSQIVFRFAMDVGMLPLTGTTNGDHMVLDREVTDFSLSEAEVNTIERLLIPG